MKLTDYMQVFLCMALTSCAGNSSQSTKLDSDDCENARQRIEKLKTYFHKSFDFIDAEFELYNVNGFSDQRLDVPGASYSDYKIAMRINFTDIEKCKTGMSEDSLKTNEDTSWTKEIVKERKENWLTSDSPKFFSSPNRRMILYEKDGIIFIRDIRN